MENSFVYHLWGKKEHSHKHHSGAYRTEKFSNSAITPSECTRLRNSKITSSEFTKLRNSAITPSEYTRLINSGMTSSDLTRLRNSAITPSDYTRLRNSTITSSGFSRSKSHDSGVKTQSSTISIKISNENDENVIIQLYPNKRKIRRHEKRKSKSKHKRQSAGGNACSCKTNTSKRNKMAEKVKICNNIYRNTFGPTVDETIIVGMETLQHLYCSDEEDSVVVERGSDTEAEEKEVKSIHVEHRYLEPIREPESIFEPEPEPEPEINAPMADTTSIKSIESSKSYGGRHTEFSYKQLASKPKCPYAQFCISQTKSKPKVNLNSDIKQKDSRKKLLSSNRSMRNEKANFSKSMYTQKELEILRKYIEIPEADKTNIAFCPYKCNKADNSKITAYFTVEPGMAPSQNSMDSESNEDLKLYRFSFNQETNGKNKVKQCNSKLKCTSKGNGSKTITTSSSSSKYKYRKRRNKSTCESVMDNKATQHDEDVPYREPVPLWQKRQTYPTAYFVQNESVKAAPLCTPCVPCTTCKEKAVSFTPSDSETTSTCTESKTQTSQEDEKEFEPQKVKKSKEYSTCSSSTKSSSSSYTPRSVNKTDCIICNITGRDCPKQREKSWLAKRKYPSAVIFPTGQTFLPTFLKKCQRSIQRSEYDVHRTNRARKIKSQPSHSSTEAQIGSSSKEITNDEIGPSYCSTFRKTTSKELPTSSDSSYADEIENTTFVTSEPNTKTKRTKTKSKESKNNSNLRQEDTSTTSSNSLESIAKQYCFPAKNSKKYIDSPDKITSDSVTYNKDIYNPEEYCSTECIEEVQNDKKRNIQPYECTPQEYCSTECLEEEDKSIKRNIIPYQCSPEEYCTTECLEEEEKYSRRNSVPYRCNPQEYCTMECLEEEDKDSTTLTESSDQTELPRRPLEKRFTKQISYPPQKGFVKSGQKKGKVKKQRRTSQEYLIADQKEQRKEKRPQVSQEYYQNQRSKYKDNNKQIAKRDLIDKYQYTPKQYCQVECLDEEEYEVEENSPRVSQDYCPIQRSKDKENKKRIVKQDLVDKYQCTPKKYCQVECLEEDSEEEEEKGKKEAKLGKFQSNVQQYCPGECLDEVEEEEIYKVESKSIQVSIPATGKKIDQKCPYQISPGQKLPTQISSDSKCMYSPAQILQLPYCLPCNSRILYSVDTQTETILPEKSNKDSGFQTGKVTPETGKNSTFKTVADETLIIEEASVKPLEAQRVTKSQLSSFPLGSTKQRSITTTTHASILSQTSQKPDSDIVGEMPGLLKQRNIVPNETRYAITRVTKYDDFTTYEVMKSTKLRPKVIPCVTEGVFIVKNKDKNKPTLEKM